MRKKVINNKVLFAFVVVISVALVVLILFDRVNQPYETKNRDKMYSKAISYYENGEYDKADLQLQYYIQNTPKDKDSIVLLGDWKWERGLFDEAKEWYQKASKIKSEDETFDGSILTLGAYDSICRIKSDIDNIKVEVKPSARMTSNMAINISHGNLLTDSYCAGKINGLSSDLIEQEDYITSEWIDIDSDQKALTIVGDFNCAIWQFKFDNDSIRFKGSDDGEVFHVLDEVSLNNKSSETVEIPEGATAVRVTFMNKTTMEESILSGKTMLVYGTYPKYAENNETLTVSIPDLNDNDILTYTNEGWFLNGEKKNDLPKLTIRKGDTVVLTGDVIGNVLIFGDEIPIKTDGQYGVRWKYDSTDTVCERIGDAEDLSFDYMCDDKWVGVGKNDFDSIAPWKDIKLCVIEEDGNIIYEDDPNFNRSGSSGDVMVEIPAHYVKRTVQDGYEEIWISATPHEGYELDPAFIQDGVTLDKIYVGAYLSGYDGQMLNSLSGEVPVINLSYNDLQQCTEKKTAGWGELDYRTLAMIQRLFLVETAVKDSQSLFAGNVDMKFGYSDISDQTLYAQFSSEDLSNTIILKNWKNSRKFAVGDSVVVLQAPEGKYYNELKKYDNSDNFKRVITDVRQANGWYYITFSGTPIQITAKQTMIMHLPRKNGKTDTIEYCTGMNTGTRGLTSFKYRHMENIWGNVCVLVGGININNGKVNIEYGNGEKREISYSLPFQDGTPSQLVGHTAFIEKMGFDAENPLIMLPVSIGNSASPTTCYSDLWVYPETSKNDNLILTYGLTWDLRNYGGLFAFRVAGVNAKAPENGSRLLYRSFTNEE